MPRWCQVREGSGWLPVAVNLASQESWPLLQQRLNISNRRLQIKPRQILQEIRL